MATATTSGGAAAAIALATQHERQQHAINTCGWCGEAPWTYSCATCDPRRTKKVCDDCAKRWHSRGFSQEHVLSNRAGEANEFRVWFRSFPDQSDAPISADSNASEEALAVAARDSNDDAQEGSQSRATPEISKQQTGVDNTPQEPQSLSADDAEMLDAINSDASADSGESTATRDDDDTEEEILQAQDEKLLPLNELLAQFPSEAPQLVDMLSEYINAAMRVQDGIACTRYTKCTQLPCTDVVKHFRHNTSSDPPCDTECRIGLEMYQHMKACSKSDCLFCIRVRLRKALNNIRAIKFLVESQKRVMKRLAQEHKDGASDAKAKYELCSTQVRDYKRKQQQLIEDVEEMNTTVLNLRVPIFNFPRPVWHIHSEPMIKMEPLEPTLSSEPSAEQTLTAKQEPPAAAAPPSAATDAKRTKASEEDRTDETAPASASNSNSGNNSTSDLAGLGADYISVLLSKKKSDPQAQQKFDEAIELAYAIVEASFCSSAKAPRCLLQCQRILDHLQHHLDLKVCDDIMCTTVEFHFAHLSMCGEEQGSGNCEYCLKVQERELMRATDIMAGEQREAEAKAQGVIDAMTASFANDSREERELAIFQLEDELEQSEEYKRGIMKKLSSARTRLRMVRERMEQLPEPVATCVHKPLPVHFIKVTRKDASAQSKKHRL